LVATLKKSRTDMPAVSFGGALSVADSDFPLLLTVSAMADLPMGKVLRDDFVNGNEPWRRWRIATKSHVDHPVLAGVVAVDGIFEIYKR